MRKILVILIVLFLSRYAQAQLVLSRTYTPGYYYDSSGKKISGLIAFELDEDRIHFKKDKNSSVEKIPISDINAVVMAHGYFNGVRVPDSLITITEDNKERKRYFAGLFFITPTTKFYSKFLEGPNSGGTSLTTLTNVPNSANNSVRTETYMSQSPIGSNNKRLVMYQEGNTTYQITKGNYIDILSKACADQPDLVTRIKNKEFKFRDISLIAGHYPFYSKPPAKPKKADEGNLDSLLHR